MLRQPGCRCESAGAEVLETGKETTLPEYVESVNQLMEQLAKLPGVGKRTAERLAYHIVRASNEEALALARAIEEVKNRVGTCSVCYNLTESDPCAICSDPKRDASVVCVVEQPKDVVAIEKAGAFKGLYHVLQGRISPLEQSGPERLTIGALVKRVREGGVREVILATNPDYEGDGTALFVQHALEGTGVKVTRLARGLPTGSALEYASPAMLSEAMARRQPIAQDS